MRVSLVSTGEEILRGEVLDTNAALAAAKLDARGFALVRRHTCGDGLDGIRETLELALAEADAVIVCGGLGPTADDRTAEALARALGVALETDQDLLRAIEARFASLGIPFTPNQARQARLPAGAESIENRAGTAPGISARSEGGAQVFCLPGPPLEYRSMLEDRVLPELESLRAKQGESAVFARRVLRVFGRGEGAVEDALGDLESEVPGLELGFRAALPEIHLKLRARADTGERAEELIEQAAKLARARLGADLFSEHDRSLPECVVEALIARGLTLAAAESCTGGLLGKLVTDVPGASETFLLSAVTYANQAKQDVLGVEADLLREHGAVSAECAQAMARGVRRIAKADIGLSTTGIAGPTGGSTDKPVGTVFVGLSTSEGTTARKLRFPPRDRDFIRRLAAHAALDLLRREVLLEA
ncbi:MAG: competence/damage-inducible protein A [Deltaproteobacteria bacterium]|nr:competence/damage-inducible protein A [Deltaproteobacteria bacterium]